MMSYSAGCLPFNIINGKLYFLLGRDRSDGTWSDFGGRAEEYDMDIKATAAREFYEESVGVVMDMESIRKRLKDADCHKMLESKTMGGSKYYTFVIHCPYQSFYPSVFQKNLKLLRYMKANKRFLEKTDVAWYSADEIFDSVDGTGKLHLRGVFANTISLHRNVLKEPELHVKNRYPSPNRYISDGL